MSSKERSRELMYDDVLFIGLTTDRSILYDKINARVDNMVDNGLLDEAFKIYSSGIRSKAVLTPIGYKNCFHTLNIKKKSFMNA